MKRSRLVGAGLALLAVPAIGLAAPDGVPGPPEGRGPGTTTNVQPAPAPKPKPVVTMIARGVVETPAANGAVEVKVSGRNAQFPRAGLGQVVTVTIGPSTRITKAGKGTATAADLKKGDRVVVQWRARKGTTSAALASIPAVRITDTGPAPARN
jgi:hypothetical protein